MRYQPDTWVDIALRPVAMAAPDANVYVEIMAPDFRFVYALALLCVVGAQGLRSRARHAASGAAVSGRNVAALLGLIAAAFVPWMATTGNGRYFLPILLLVGPLCVGLACLLPVSRAMRLAVVAGMIVLQAFAVQQSDPWRAWGMSAWKQPPYFHVDLPPDARSEPATYVTMAAISYSLVAPLFHPDSRWMSLHNAPAPATGSRDAGRTEDFLARARPGKLMLLVPVVYGSLTPERLPDEAVARALDGQLLRYWLSLSRPLSCRFLPSRTMAEFGLGEKTPELLAQSGFWLCHLERMSASARADRPATSRHDEVFRRLEGHCPRFFPAGGDHGTQQLPGGETRTYLSGEMKAYVYDNGDIFYKYYRAMNPVKIGSVRDVLAGKVRLDCNRIRGRSGLPWNREI